MPFRPCRTILSVPPVIVRYILQVSTSRVPNKCPSARILKITQGVWRGVGKGVVTPAKNRLRVNLRRTAPDWKWEQLEQCELVAGIESFGFTFQAVGRFDDGGIVDTPALCFIAERGDTGPPAELSIYGSTSSIYWRRWGRLYTLLRKRVGNRSATDEALRRRGWLCGSVCIVGPSLSAPLFLICHHESPLQKQTQEITRNSPAKCLLRNPR